MIIDIEKLKLYLDIDNSDYDTILKEITKGAINFAENYCNNILSEQTGVIEVFDVDNDDSIYLGANNNIVITSLEKNNGDEFDEDFEALTTSDYALYEKEGRIKIKSIISGCKAYKLTYTAGYTSDNVPEALKLGLYKLISTFWNKRKSDGVSNESLSDANITWKTLMNTETKAVLDKYKLYAVHV